LTATLVGEGLGAGVPLGATMDEATGVATLEETGAMMGGEVATGPVELVGEAASTDGAGCATEPAHAPPSVFSPWSSGLIRVESLTPAGESQ
jgi:hypothetical protein